MSALTVRDLIDWCVSRSACDDALDWLSTLDSDTPAYHAWRACERGDWLIWVAARVVDRKLTVLAVCDCAELALVHVPNGEDRPRVALETARRWCMGSASVADVRRASEAAYDAAHAATDDAAAAYEAAYAVYAYAADAAAAYTAAYTAADAAASYAAASYVAAYAAYAAYTASDEYAADGSTAAAAAVSEAAAAAAAARRRTADAAAAAVADTAAADAYAASRRTADSASYAAYADASDAASRRTASAIRSRIPWRLVAEGVES